jgi:hypothetical protein
MSWPFVFSATDCGPEVNNAQWFQQKVTDEAVKWTSPASQSQLSKRTH